MSSPTVMDLNPTVITDINTVRAPTKEGTARPAPSPGAEAALGSPAAAARAPWRLRTARARSAEPPPSSQAYVTISGWLVFFMQVRALDPCKCTR